MELIIKTNQKLTIPRNSPFRALRPPIIRGVNFKLTFSSEQFAKFISEIAQISNLKYY